MTEAPAAPTYAELVNDTALSLSPFERRCGLLWPSLQDYALIAAQVYPEEYASRERREMSNTKWREFEREALRRVKWAVNAVFRQLERHHYGEVREAVQDHQRAILDAYANRRETGRPAEKQIGARPYGELDNESLAERRTWDEYQAAKADPWNYCEVSLRAPVVTVAVLEKLTPTERLTTLARHLSARAELASASL